MKQQIGLSLEEKKRYSRHIALPGFSENTQILLKQSRVLVVGVGGLGCPVLLYLAAAGIGILGIVDHDDVDESNLQRQILFDTDDIGKTKVLVAKKKLCLLNPHIQVISYHTRLTSKNIFNVIDDYDIIVDGSDNFPTRYLVNDACVLRNKILVYASVHQHEGQLSVFNYPLEEGGRGPNYRDLFPQPPPPDQIPSCAEGGVIGALAGILGTMQANEVIKIITGIGEPLYGKLYLFDAFGLLSRIIKISNRPDTSIVRLVDYEKFCNPSLNQKDNMLKEIDVYTLQEWQLKGKDFQLVDVREAYERDISTIGGELIPVGRILQELESIQKDKDVVIYCRSGARSASAVLALQKMHGLENLYNLKGGILDWADKIDPSLAKY